MVAFAAAVFSRKGRTRPCQRRRTRRRSSFHRSNMLVTELAFWTLLLRCRFLLLWGLTLDTAGGLLDEVRACLVCRTGVLRGENGQ